VLSDALDRRAKRADHLQSHFVDLEAFHRNLRAAANGPSGSDDGPRARRKHETTGSARNHPGRWRMAAIDNTLTLLEVTDEQWARRRDVCRSPVLAKSVVGREAASEYRVRHSK
jgi:hypothetical protein